MSRKRLVIELARLVRETATVTVDVPESFNTNDKYKVDELMRDLFDYDDHDYHIDYEWGCDSGGHYVSSKYDITDSSKGDFRLTDCGRVERNK
jgi:hypothetical protein